MDIAPRCPYCKGWSVPATGKDIYPHRSDLFAKKFFWCVDCDAFVGTHARTGLPLGTLANSTLRRLRSLAHSTFDTLWKEHGIDRTVAYAMLAKGMDVPFDECHIAMFDNAQCRRVVDLVNSKEIFRYERSCTPPPGPPDQASN